MAKRPTRLRRTKAVRQLVKENHLHMDQIIYPIFLVEGNGIKEEISSMKDQFHYSIDLLLEDIPMFIEKGIGKLLLFANITHKSKDGSSGSDETGLVQECIRQIKYNFPQMLVIADVCLCQYKDDGHCCIYKKNSEIDRLATLEVLSDIALSYAKAGADIVAPSDMMDGRVKDIRKKLDNNGFEHVSIMAYSAKYASSYYGPFREAAHSAPSFGDRKSYQMDPANSLEALREIELDIKEGADIVMIKPAMLYLDIIHLAKEHVQVPIAAYQVSGEYAMIRSAVDQGQINSRGIYESLISIKRSGASIIISYFAKEIQEIILKEEPL